MTVVGYLHASHRRRRHRPQRHKLLHAQRRADGADISTLYELSGVRMKFGIGAWWAPLASKVGIDSEKADQVNEELGGWPAMSEDIERAERFVGDDVVERICDYCEASCTEPVVYPLIGHTEEVINVITDVKTEF
jgi:hypothetical protein